MIGHECRTVVECGWSGKKNGELLAEADPVFGLADLTAKRIAVLIVRARSNRIQELLPILPERLAALASIQPRQVVCVGSLPSR